MQAFRSPAFPKWPAWPTFRTTLRPPGSLADGPVYYVRTSNGDTWTTLVNLLTGLVAGDWVNPLSGVTTNDLADSWYVAYRAGTRRVTGGTIALDTTGGALKATSAITIPAGWELVSAHATPASLYCNLPVTGETWNTTAQSKVYESTLTVYQNSVLYELVAGQPAQLVPVFAANRAAALPLLQATAGTFYADPATNKMLTHPFGDTDPRSDAKSREYVPAWAATLTGRIVNADGGRLYNLSGDGGCGADPTSQLPGGAAWFGVGNNGTLSVIDACTASRCGSHSFSAVGNGTTGFTVFRNCVAKQGPGGYSFANWSHYVDYTSAAGSGTIRTIYDACSTASAVQNQDGTAGGNNNYDGGIGYIAILRHTNGSNTAFAYQTLTNCTFPNGQAALGNNTATLVTSGNSYGCLATFQATASTSTGDSFTQMPAFTAGTTATLVSPTILAGTIFTGTPADLAGTVTLTNPTLLLAEGNIYSTAWTRTGTYSLTLTNPTIATAPNATSGLVDAFAVGTDALSITTPTLAVGPFWDLIHDYNSTGVSRTYAQSVSDGRVTGQTYAPVSQVNMNTSLVYQDSGRTTLATNDGDPVALVHDRRGRGYGYHTCTNCTLGVSGGKKTLVTNGTNAKAVFAFDCQAASKAVTVAFAVNPTTTGPYLPVATVGVVTGGFRMFSQLGTNKWGGYNAGDQPSGTALVNGTNYQLAMSIAADTSGTFYTNGAADGTMTGTGGSGGDTAWELNLAFEGAANRWLAAKYAGWQVDLSAAYSGGQQAALATTLAAMQ